MQGTEPTWLQRAKPLLGTLVVIRVPTEQATETDFESNRILALMQRSFDAIEEIANAMSAHHADSDLARIARAAPGDVLTLSPHTVAVLRLAKYWHRTSLGTFDPVKAADRLAAKGIRPAFGGVTLAARASLHDLQVLSGHQVKLVRPMRLDLGGIAKGYAVDQAIAVLQAHGVHTALVNAGGDLRGVTSVCLNVRSGSPSPG
jgi:thiamine biosynthesis lipoprotein